MPSHRRPPAPVHRIAAASVWADNLPQLCKWLTFAAAVVLCAGGLAVPFVGGLNTQVQAATAEHLALTPERPAEPSAHGGPLAPLSIGVVAPETGAGVVRQAPTEANRTRLRPPQRPQEALGTVRGSTDTQTAPTGVPSATPAAATTTPEPTATTPTQAATTTPTATTPRTCHRWWCHTSPAATTTATTTAVTTTEATETTSEPSDPLATLISDAIGTEGP